MHRGWNRKGRGNMPSVRMIENVPCAWPKCARNGTKWCPDARFMPFAEDEEAVALANDTKYGLAAGVWTSDLKRGHRMIRDLQVGSVWVNAYRRIHWALPFGGFGNSGFGKDSGLESVLENTRIKTGWVDLS